MDEVHFCFYKLTSHRKTQEPTDQNVPLKQTKTKLKIFSFNVRVQADYFYVHLFFTGDAFIFVRTNIYNKEQVFSTCKALNRKTKR